MISIKKIAITGDFLRINRDGAFAQSTNIRWLYSLVSPFISLLCKEITPTMVTGSLSAESITNKFYMARGTLPSLNAWVTLYDSIPNLRQQALLQTYFSHSLVISFELPEIVKIGLIELNIPFIDFTIHPVRFMRDLLFGVRSNIPLVQEAFAPWRVYEDSIRIEAGCAQATLCRLPRLKSCQDAEDIALFACQTSEDKVLIQNGQLLTTEKFFDDFVKISCNHDKILVKPHPYEKNKNNQYLLSQLFTKSEIIESNFYHILSHENVTAIYSLTSSTTIEARYFNKKGIHIAQYPYIFSENTLSEKIYMSIKPCFLQANLWMKIFELLNIPLKKAKHIPTIDIDMRKSLGNYWGADILFH